MMRPSRTNARSTSRDVLGLVVVFDVRRTARRFGAGGQRERLAEQVVGAVVAAQHEAGVDQPLQRAAGRARVEARELADLCALRRSQHQRGENAPPVLVGEQADELARLERRLRHSR